MTETMWITVSLFFALYLYADAQTTVSLKAIEGDDVTLSCTLSGTFTLPFWQGPPSLTPYTIQDDVSETINPAAPAASRLQFASNKKDLVLSNASISDIGNYKCSYAGSGDHTITLSVTAKATTTTSSTTTTTPLASTTTTTTPASTTTTTTPASTTTTTTASTTTTTLDSTTTTTLDSTTTPASTTTTMSSTTTTTTPTTKKSSPTKTAAPVTTPSTTSLSDEMIIVIVVVPVGVIAVIGIVILVCLFYRLRKGKRNPISHKGHKRYNMRQVQQHQQQPYILYGRGRKGKSNQKETKRSRSLHNDDRYNLYDGYHLGSQVKQNPVYKGDRNLGRLYYNETLPRYDGYRSGYTRGHVYPSHTSGYQYRRYDHGDSRGHGNRQHSSYPVYSTQQEYINPSYLYMGY